MASNDPPPARHDHDDPLTALARAIQRRYGADRPTRKHDARSLRALTRELRTSRDHRHTHTPAPRP